MSRWGGPRGSGDDLAYGDPPQRWDRSRFEQMGQGPPPRRVEEDYRYTERDRPGRQDIAVQDRIQTAGPRGRYEERDRFVEEERQTPGGRRRRTDRELFGDVDPREIAEMAMTPYKGKSATRRDLDMDQRSIAPQPPPPRPGMIRRQSSLDTFDRRPVPRYERETIRIPSYQPVPPPIPRDRYREDDFFEETTRRGRDYYQTRGLPRGGDYAGALSPPT